MMIIVLCSENGRGDIFCLFIHSSSFFSLSLSSVSRQCTQILTEKRKKKKGKKEKGKRAQEKKEEEKEKAT